MLVLTFCNPFFATSHRFAHDDGTCTSHLSAYTPASTTSTTAAHYGSGTYKLPRSYLSVGCESGVVSIFGADRDAFSGAYDFTGGSLGGVPKQLKSVMNLTTQITSTCFHPSGQILAIASNQVSTQLRSLICFPVSHGYFGVSVVKLVFCKHLPFS